MWLIPLCVLTTQVALVDYQLKHMLNQGALRLGGAEVDLHKYVQPASVDLPISGTVYLVKEKVLPFCKQVCVYACIYMQIHTR